MRPVGFSTGSLALGDFRKAISMMRGMGFTAIELSALREGELEHLVKSLDALDLTEFGYVSVHAPSHLHNMEERELIDLLRIIADHRFPIVIHPDVIQNFSRWDEFGALLLIENMDKRKPIGRTAPELSRIFARLPKAMLCLDLGHVKQFDPTMSHAGEILRQFSDRLAELHLSEVNSSSQHEPLNEAAIDAFRSMAHLIAGDVPVIIESPVEEASLEDEASTALRALISSRPVTSKAVIAAH